jgi:hypothetical protein
MHHTLSAMSEITAERSCETARLDTGGVATAGRPLAPRTRRACSFGAAIGRRRGSPNTKRSAPAAQNPGGCEPVSAAEK